MKAIAQQIAIAKACGKIIPPYTLSEEYVDDPRWNSGFWETTALFADGTKVCFFAQQSNIDTASWGHRYAERMFPDYLNDLNAMFEAEKVLTEAQKVEYARHIFCAEQQVHEESDETWHRCVFATAAQRAEAFLRTIGKWED